MLLQGHLAQNSAGKTRFYDLAMQTPIVCSAEGAANAAGTGAPVPFSASRPEALRLPLF
jgi:hypothetical protein